jgi:hypothetical protein
LCQKFPKDSAELFVGIGNKVREVKMRIFLSFCLFEGNKIKFGAEYFVKKEKISYSQINYVKSECKFPKVILFMKFYLFY